MSKIKELKKIEKKVKICKKCNLYKTRKNTVFGDGSFKAKILFIGEAPGKNEDLKGYPFVGRAGKILDELLNSIDLKRKEIYITNILKCRPTNNRNPLKKEIDICSKFLDKQIDIIAPEIIAPLGNFACSFIFEKFGLKYDKISQIHGKMFNTESDFGKIKIIPLFHPAVATYNPNKIDILIKDFKQLKKII